MSGRASYRGLSAEARRSQRRKRLIASAIEIFGEVGYRNATVRMICKRAQLTERYFYESFASSEELLLETARTLALQTLEWMRQIRDDGDASPNGRTRRMLEAYYKLQYEQPSKARAFTLEFRGISAAADAEFERILEAYADLILDTRDPQRRGPAAGDRLLLRGIVGGVLQMTIAWIEGGYREPLEAVAAAALRICTLADPD